MRRMRERGRGRGMSRGEKGGAWVVRNEESRKKGRAWGGTERRGKENHSVSLVLVCSVLISNNAADEGIQRGGNPAGYPAV